MANVNVLLEERNHSLINLLVRLRKSFLEEKGISLDKAINDILHNYFERLIYDKDPERGRISEGIRHILQLAEEQRKSASSTGVSELSESKTSRQRTASHIRKLRTDKIK